MIMTRTKGTGAPCSPRLGRIRPRRTAPAAPRRGHQTTARPGHRPRGASKSRPPPARGRFNRRAVSLAIAITSMAHPQPPADSNLHTTRGQKGRGPGITRLARLYILGGAPLPPPPPSPGPEEEEGREKNGRLEKRGSCPCLE